MKNTVVMVNVTEHQSLGITIFMLHGDTCGGAFPSDERAVVQYGENLQALREFIDWIVKQEG